MLRGQFTQIKKSTLEIQQTFNYPQDHENETKALEKVGWDIVTTIKLKAKEAEAFSDFCDCPILSRLVYTNGNSEQKNSEPLLAPRRRSRV